jgi:hypothetical protein
MRLSPKAFVVLLLGEIQQWRPTTAALSNSAR